MAFQLAIGEKVALVIYLVSMLICGLIISFMKGWELTLVMLAFLPIFAFFWWLMVYFSKKRSEFEEEIFQSAGGFANEAIQCIKIVKQFNG